MRASRFVLNWREEYHATQGPRRLALKKWLDEHPEARPKNQPIGMRAQKPTEVLRPNRWWVNQQGEFMEQIQVIEDPAVIERVRTKLPDPTHEDLWKKNQCPFFTPQDAVLRVLDFPQDPDAKHLYATNLPKWKDFMKRERPPIPRTWY